jgi:hypothetical protein
MFKVRIREKPRKSSEALWGLAFREIQEALLVQAIGAGPTWRLKLIIINAATLCGRRLACGIGPAGIKEA